MYIQKPGVYASVILATVDKFVINQSVKLIQIDMRAVDLVKLQTMEPTCAANYIHIVESHARDH